MDVHPPDCCRSTLSLFFVISALVIGAVVGAFLYDDNGSESGSAYVFMRKGGSLTQQAKLTASDGAAGDRSGRFVAVDGEGTSDAQSGAWPPGEVEKNVVYGMISGLALLMDVYYPERPNGTGIVVIPGSGWYAPFGYGVQDLKEAGPWGAHRWVLSPFFDAGYTLFVINHRAAPRFQYPAAVEDAQRAVRFVRHHADRFGVDPKRLGAKGGSSGGHLVSLLGTLDGEGDPEAPDPVSRESAKVQAVVASAAPADMREFDSSMGVGAVTSFMGYGIPRGAVAKEWRNAYREASPIEHVSPDDAPFFLMHGEEDSVVPFRQAISMRDALREVGVDVELLRIPGGDHGAPNPFYYRSLGWLNRHLLSDSAAAALEPLSRAYGLLMKGGKAVREGEVSRALELYRRAQERSERLHVNPALWNDLCWFGSLHGAVEQVLFACERAVEQLPAAAPFRAYHRDSRGLARALTGDANGAIEDFRAAVEEWPGARDAVRTRQHWIEELQAGENPFTEPVLQDLLQGSLRPHWDAVGGV